MSGEISTVPTAKPAQNKAQQKKQQPRKQTAKDRAREFGKALKGETPAHYQVHGTEVKVSMRVGNNDLARAVKMNWSSIHHSLHYITDFSVRHIGGKIVSTANRAISEYIGQKIEGMTEAMKTGMATAEDNFVKLGEAGSMNQFEVKVACDKERDVMELIKLMDDYVIVADSLWIGKFMDKKKRDVVHDEIVGTIEQLNRLLLKVRTKMIDYRKRRQTNSLQKEEQGYINEIEQMLLSMSGISLQKIYEAEKAKRDQSRKPQQPKKQQQQGTAANDVVVQAIADQESKLVAA